MKKLTIALVAHDNRKAEMVEWAVHNAEFLSHHHIVCTGTTGNLVRKALEEKGVNADIACMHSGPMGKKPRRNHKRYNGHESHSFI